MILDTITPSVGNELNQFVMDRAEEGFGSRFDPRFVDFFMFVTNRLVKQDIATKMRKRVLV
jgi:hypothetical protein